MLKILCIGDLHFKVGNSKIMDVVCREIHRVIDEEDPDLIVSMGDVLDSHERVHIVPQGLASDFLKALAKRKPTVNLIGNHDLRGPNEFLSPVHSLAPLKGWPNLEIVDVGSTREMQGARLCFLPYVPNGRLMDAFAAIGKKPEDFDVVFCHQELYGVKVGGLPSETGDRWAASYPLIVCGHIHDYAQVADNILYVGTPVQHAFGDPEDRSLSLLIHEGGLDWSEKRCMLDVPKKVIRHVVFSDLTVDPDPAAHLLARDLDEVQIRVSGSAAELKQAMRHASIRLLQRRGAKVALVCSELNAPNADRIPDKAQDRSFSKRLPVLLQSEFPELLPLFYKIRQ